MAPNSRTAGENKMNGRPAVKLHFLVFRFSPHFPEVLFRSNVAFFNATG
jgi:hypothetical protein